MSCLLMLHRVALLLIPLTLSSKPSAGFAISIGQLEHIQDTVLSGALNSIRAFMLSLLTT